MKRLVRYIFLLCFVVEANANPRLPLVLGSNMVLQAGKPIVVWGKADPGEQIAVLFYGQELKTTTRPDSGWQVTLQARPASSQPFELIIRGNQTIILKNILIGEVWLCSGQSNMEYTMTKSSKYAHAKKSTGLDSAALSQERNPLIRLFLVKRDLNKPGDINKGWNEAEGGSLSAFSAAGYHFAKELQKQLGVPVGMIASSISGSAIEPWMSGTPLNAGDAQSFTINTSSPGKFYSGMIEPLAPFAMSGFLWYQGETNCFQQETIEYSNKFKQLIGSWRSLWKDDSMPFYFVSIAPFNYSKSEGKNLKENFLPFFREAQSAALELPHTAMITTTDLVDNTQDIHPTYKWEIGRRLCLLALKNHYGKKVEDSGPKMKKVMLEKSIAVVEFDHVAKGLTTNDGLPVSGFLLGDEEGRFETARATISNGKVMLTAPGLVPKYVRFAWNENAQPNLVNAEKLPTVPFRTDHFNP